MQKTAFKFVSHPFTLQHDQLEPTFWNSLLEESGCTSIGTWKTERQDRRIARKHLIGHHKTWEIQETARPRQTQMGQPQSTSQNKICICLQICRAISIRYNDDGYSLRQRLNMFCYQNRSVTTLWPSCQMNGGSSIGPYPKEVYQPARCWGWSRVHWCGSWKVLGFDTGEKRCQDSGWRQRSRFRSRS